MFPSGKRKLKTCVPLMSRPLERGGGIDLRGSITAASMTGFLHRPARIMRATSFHTFCKGAPALCAESRSRQVQTRQVWTVVYSVWVVSAYVSHICCERNKSDLCADKIARAWLLLYVRKRPSVNTSHQLMSQINMSVIMGAPLNALTLF